MKHLYPFAPLARAMGLSEAAAARFLNISGSTQQQYRKQGMSELVADRMAVKAGLHPMTVWPQMVEIALTQERARQAAIRRAWLQTPRGQQIQREAKKRWRESTNGYAQEQDRKRAAEWRNANHTKKKMTDRAYYERTADAQKAARRERYLANREAELERQRAYDRRKRAEGQQGARGGVAA